MTLKVAGVGAGYFAQYHYEAWQRMPDVALEAVCDHDADRARSTAARHGIPMVFDDLEKMLRQTAPDVVDIITPPESHQLLTDIAGTAGAAVICQKPLAPDLPTAERMVEAAEAHNTFFAAHENFRFQPWYREIRSLLDREILGEVGTHPLGG